MTTDERIAKLEAQIEQLQDAQATATRELAATRIEQWQARIDDLEVQLHLGGLEAKDRLTGLSEELQTRWSQVRQQVGSASSTTAGVADTLRAGIEGAYHELRNALLESKKKMG